MPTTKHSSHGRLWYVLLPWLICGVGALFYCYEYFLRVTPSVMQPELMSTFGITMRCSVPSALYYNAYSTHAAARGHADGPLGHDAYSPWLV